MEDKLKFEDHNLEEPVNFKVLTEMETKLGKNGTPAIKLGMRCTNKDGIEFDGWINYVLWGTINSAPFVEQFTSSINKDIDVKWDGDMWSGYDSNMKPFKFAEGQCTLTPNKVGDKVYYNVDKILPYKKKEKEDEEPEQKPITITDADIPF